MGENSFANRQQEKRSVTDNSTFCIMPWVHFHIAQNGNVVPCCQAPPHKVHRFGSINEESLEDIWNGEAIQQFRRNMLTGKRDVRCKQCYIKEEQGWNSLRKITNNKFKDEINTVEKSGVKAEWPVYFDLRFSNACNLKCRICGPWASSQWYKDAVAMGMRKTNDKALTLSIKDEERFFEELLPLLPTAKEFYFAGGEPLMMDQHYKILDALIECGNTDIQLSYNTNFSNLEFKAYRVVDYWKQFPNIYIAASIDAEKERGELLRKNLIWEKVIANRKTLIKDLPHVEFMVSPTVCIFNVAHLPDFHKSWVQQNLIQVEDFIPNVLINPKEYHISVLPMDEQLRVKEKYLTHLNWIKIQNHTDLEKFKYMVQQFESIEQQLGQKESKDGLEGFNQKTRQLDSLRGDDSISVFPELVKLLKH